MNARVMNAILYSPISVSLMLICHRVDAKQKTKTSLVAYRAYAPSSSFTPSSRLVC